MAGKICKVTIGNKTQEFVAGTTLIEVLNAFADVDIREVALAAVNGRLRELGKVIESDATITIVPFSDKIGARTYQRSMSFLLLKAIYHVGGQEHIEKVVLHHSIGAGFYYTIRGDIKITSQFIADVKAFMNEQIAKAIPIIKKSVDIDEAKAIFRRHGMTDKERLFRYRQVSSVNIYSIGEFEDYFYGYMVHDTGYLKWFDIHPYDEGFVLQMPTRENTKEVPPLASMPKVFEVQKETEKMGEMLGVDTVGAMDDLICRGGMQKLLLISEAWQESNIARIAGEIASREGIKFVMIAGPSSSGKTTFSHRLSTQLEAHGLTPHAIAVDNYYVNAKDIPVDENGERDYECLESIDVKQFNKDMVALLGGAKVEMPRFDFVEGKRKYKGDFLQLGEHDILVIEGIHGLNDKLSIDLPKDKKFKIYISALTQLNVDDHNSISTTDVRLLRRMVRDNRTRGTNAKETISMWPSVGRGEEKYIFPFQEDADVMFNSTLLYELAVLKLYSEPLLYQIKQEDEEYLEAKRLLKFLDYFIGVPSDDIPHNSIVREFIGGGCFDI